MEKILLFPKISENFCSGSSVSLGGCVQKMMARASSPSPLIWSDCMPRPSRHPQVLSQDDSDNS